jgi:hypothetical protein
MDRAGDKFPERVEVLERGMSKRKPARTKVACELISSRLSQANLARIKIVRRRVMHVGREPDGVADVPALPTWTRGTSYSCRDEYVKIEAKLKSGFPDDTAPAAEHSPTAARQDTNGSWPTMALSAR